MVLFLCARDGKESHKPTAQVTLAWYLQFFVNEPLKFEPGKGWAYGNAGMMVAGLIVEKVSGQNYFDYVREHIYKPAGMKDSDR
jgi:CubicO group peptidase (beta-lactamase class C family)